MRNWFGEDNSLALGMSSYLLGDVYRYEMWNKGLHMRSGLEKKDSKNS